MLLEGILSLIGLLIMLAILGAIVFLPIFAVIQFQNLRRRLKTLEEDVAHLRKRRASEPRPAREPVEPTTAEQPAIPVLELAPESTPRRKRKPTPTPVADTGPDWSKLEAWLGVRGLGWAAAALLVITGAYFLKLVFDRGLIGELGRVMIGVGLGTVLCVAGWRCHHRGQTVFSQMLTAAGVGLLYLSTFATFGFYRILNKEQAAPFLILLVGQTFAIAALYRAPTIAIMAVAAGLLNPILLDSGQDRYRELFTYLAILNGGGVIVGLFRRWWVVTTLALVGTQLFFWLWYDQSYHPAKLGACLLFQLTVFVLYMGHALLVHVWQKHRANVEDLIRLLVLTAFASSAGYVLLDDKYHEWMGTFAIAAATIYALLTAAVSRWRPEDEPLLLVLLALAMSLVAAVFPLQMEAAWIAVGWAVQGLTLWWFGLRIRTPLLYGFGGAFLLLALARLFFVDTLDKGTPHSDVFIPIFNQYGLPAVIVSCSLIVAALLQRRVMLAAHPGGEFPYSGGFVAMRLLGLAGVVALWIVLSIETHDFFVVRANPFTPGGRALLTQQERELPQDRLQQLFFEREQHLRLMAQMALSALWAVYALVQLAVGLRLQHRPLRWLGLGLFALTLGKVMLVDTNRLDGMYRVGAFFALSLMMAAGAWAYQKLRHVLSVDTEVEHESNV